MSTAQAPGRLILSGEHSVVYGQPALAMAIDKVAETRMDSRLRGNDKKGRGNDTSFSSLDLNYKQSISTELLQYAFKHICDQFNINLAHGLEIRTQSNISIGCGFGSSAAVIISLMHAVINFFALDVTVNEYLQLGREIENLPHGRSSGLDLYLAIHGGCVRFAGKETVARAMPEIPIHVINTGKPKTNTGECVNFASKYFRASNSLAQDFGAVTDSLDKALQANNLADIKECIRANHKLLTAIGVVPEKVRNFIAQVESLGGAAKICGAGACAGQNAGAVLAVTEADFSAIVTDYGYEIFPVKGNTCGMQII
jgi:mevalonate kinase